MTFSIFIRNILLALAIVHTSYGNQIFETTVKKQVIEKNEHALDNRAFEMVKQYNAMVAQNITEAAKGVVNIYAPIVQQHPLSMFSNDHFFRHFFGSELPYQSRIEIGSGSGVIIDQDGLLITCAHVVQDAKVIKIKLNDGRTFDAEKEYIDEQIDIAFYKIKKGNNEKIPFVKMGDSNQLKPTETIFAIGNAFNIGQSITKGIVSAKRRIIDGKIFFQTDAAVNPGNSGGGVFNELGEYIGIPSAIATRTGANHGVGFIIPSKIASILLEKRKNDSLENTLWIGFKLQNLTYDLAKAFEGFNFNNYEGGLIVKHINPKSPFYKKISKGDIILTVNDMVAPSVDLFNHFVKMHIQKDPFKLKIWNKERGEFEVYAHLSSIPKSEQGNTLKLSGNHILKGFVLGIATPEIIQKEDLSPNIEGKVIVVKLPFNEKNETLFGFSLSVGDEILKLNDTPIKSLDQVNEILEDGFKSIVVRSGNKVFTYNQL